VFAEGFITVDHASAIQRVDAVHYRSIACLPARDRLTIAVADTVRPVWGAAIAFGGSTVFDVRSDKTRATPVGNDDCHPGVV